MNSTTQSCTKYNATGTAPTSPRPAVATANDAYVPQLVPVLYCDSMLECQVVLDLICRRGNVDSGICGYAGEGDRWHVWCLLCPDDIEDVEQGLVYHDEAKECRRLWRSL